MAARRENFSREQRIKEISVKSVETKESEGPEVSLEEVLEMLTRNFTALRPSISNFSDFREEARQLMLNVYRWHKDGVHGMENPLMSSLPAWPMITSEFLMWLNGIRRRMSANPKASNRWAIEVMRDLYGGRGLPLSFQGISFFF